MTEERITEVQTPEGNTHTHTTVVTDQPRSGGGSTWLMLALLIVVAVVGLIVFSQMSEAEVVKDTAVADAAAEVGEAAGQVGDAAQEAVDKVTR